MVRSTYVLVVIIRLGLARRQIGFSLKEEKFIRQNIQ